MNTISIWCEPVPGKEWEHYLAWKHRHIAGAWLYRLSRNPFAWRTYNRAFKLWGRAVDRTKMYTVTKCAPS